MLPTVLDFGERRHFAGLFAKKAQVRTLQTAPTFPVGALQLVEAAGQCIRIFRCGLDYAFTRMTRVRGVLSGLATES